MTNNSSASPEKFYNEANIEALAKEFLPKRKIEKKEQRFLVFLGAGASVDSKIDSANNMIKDFTNEICEKECPDLTKDEEKEAWVRNYYQDDEDKYSSLFEKRHRTELERRDKIVKIVKGKDPSLGYIILAHLIKEQFVDTIITTNFDDLVYQACTTYANIRPTVFSLGGFSSEINFESDHPKVLKIHGDFMFSKLANTRKELKKTDPNMKRQVIQMFSDYKGVIVIGYAGNDKSIRRLFKRLPKNKYLFWCHYQNENNTDSEKDKVNEKLTFLDKNLYINQKERFVVPISGFDKLMIDICKSSEIDNKDIISPSVRRFRKFIRSFRDFGLSRNEIANSEKQKFTKSLRRQYSKISRSFDAVQYFILGDKAYLNKNFEEAKNYYKKAIKKKENEADGYYNYAKVLSQHPEHYEEAEENFRKAMKLSPKDNYIKNRLANLLVKMGEKETGIKVHTIFDEAETIYKTIIAEEQRYAYAHFEYGNFLVKKKDYDSAEEQYRKAFNLEPKNAEICYKLGMLFLENGPDNEKAKEWFEKACEVQPDFAAAYIQLHLLSEDDESYRNELNIREKASRYKEQFYAFGLQSAIDLKMSGNTNLTKYIDVAKGYYKNFFETDLYKKAQINFLEDENKKGIEALKIAVQENPSYKNLAKWDLSMQWIYKDPEFQEIIKEEVK